MLDIMDWVHPDLQVILEVDHSSGHLKPKDDGLSINGMNLGFGGKQGNVRETLIKDEVVLVKIYNILLNYL